MQVCLDHLPQVVTVSAQGARWWGDETRAHQWPTAGCHATQGGEKTASPQSQEKKPLPLTCILQSSLLTKVNIAFAAQEKCLKLSYHRAGEEVWIWGWWAVGVELDPGLRPLPIWFTMPLWFCSSLWSSGLKESVLPSLFFVKFYPCHSRPWQASVDCLLTVLSLWFSQFWDVSSSCFLMVSLIRL